MSLTPNSIITAQTPKTSSCVCTGANANYTDAPTNTAVLFTAGPNGARITRITALARASIVTNPTELQLFRDGDGSGSAKRLFRSKAMPVYAVAQTSGQDGVDFGYDDVNPLILAGNEKIYAAIGVANTGIVFSAEGADF